MLDVSIISPERVLYEGAVESITVPGAKASFSVFKGHIPIISELEPGLIQVKEESGEVKQYIVSGGFVDVANDKVSALVESALSPSEINVEDDKKALEELVKESAINDSEAHIKKMNELRARIRYAK